MTNWHPASRNNKGLASRSKELLARCLTALPFNVFLGCCCEWQTHNWGSWKTNKELTNASSNKRAYHFAELDLEHYTFKNLPIQWFVFWCPHQLTSISWMWLLAGSKAWCHSWIGQQLTVSKTNCISSTTAGCIWKDFASIKKNYLSH